MVKGYTGCLTPIQKLAYCECNLKLVPGQLHRNSGLVTRLLWVLDMLVYMWFLFDGACDAVNKC